MYWNGFLGIGGPMRWYIVKTRLFYEERVTKRLTDLDFTNLLPLACVHQRQRDGLLVEKTYPLFRTYVFVQFDVEDLRWRKIWGLVGVKGIMGAREVPMPVRDSEIQHLVELLREGGGSIPLLTSRPKIISPGMMVRVMFGPFRDQTAPVQADCGSRVEVLLKVCGAMRPVKLSREVLIAAE